jgi:hypothetical protein
MQNPFESGHIKNYLLLYASVVVIMILFFIASSLFNDVEKVPKRVFKEGKVKKLKQKSKVTEQQKKDSKFKLIDTSY